MLKDMKTIKFGIVGLLLIITVPLAMYFAYHLYSYIFTGTFNSSIEQMFLAFISAMVLSMVTSAVAVWWEVK